MRIPTILSDGVGQTGQVAPRVSFSQAEATAASGRAIAGGLQDLGQGINRYTHERNQRLLERQRYDDRMYSEQKFTEAQRKMIQWTQDVQKNGSEDVVEQFNAVFPEYQKTAIEQAPTQGAKDMLKLKLDDLGTSVFQSSLQIEASNRAKNTISTFGKMLDDATDTIAQQPESYSSEQSRLQSLLEMTKEMKRAPQEAINQIQDQINALGANAAEAMIPKNPQVAKEILDGVKGIPWARRRSIENAIDQANQSNSTLFHYDQVELAKSNFESILATGKPVPNFNLDQYAASFPEKQQEAARKEAESQIAIANSTYVASTEMRGAPISKLNAILKSKTPVPGDPNYSDQQAVFKHLQQVANQQEKLLDKDSFTYARQDPIVDAAWKMVENLPQDTKPELRQQLGQQAMDATVNYQKSIGVPEGSVAVMSADMAKSTAATINQGDTQTIQQTFQGLMKTYGKYYQNAFRDMARLPEGERISADMQIVALHIGEPFLADFVQASKTKMSDFKVEDTDKKDLKEKLGTNGNFMAFSQALMAANSANVSYVDDFRQAIDKYSTSLLFRGKAKSPADAVKQATDLIIGNAYAFTQVNGSTIAVKKSQEFGRLEEKDTRNIRNNMRNFQRDITAANIDTSQFYFPEGISGEVRARSITDTLRHDTFWSTNPQNDGVILYMNGAQGQVAPVKYKDGTRVEKKFKDLMIQTNNDYEYARTHPGIMITQ